MRVALLCPGPSLVSTYTPGGHDLVIGVNRAALRFPCDWWAFCDWQRFVEDDVGYRPKLYTTEESIRCICLRPERGERFDRHERQTFDALQAHVPAALGWTLYTAPAALVLAYWLGATRVDCYGCDWTDAPDFDGVNLETNVRGAARWKQEGEIWNALTAWLKDRGTEVERVHGIVERSTCD